MYLLKLRIYLCYGKLISCSTCFLFSGAMTYFPIKISTGFPMKCFDYNVASLSYMIPVL